MKPENQKIEHERKEEVEMEETKTYRCNGEWIWKANLDLTAMAEEEKKKRKNFVCRD